MNYFKGKIAENLHVPELVEVVRVNSTKQFTKYGKRVPYLNQTLPTPRMTDKQRTKLLKKIERIAHWLDNAVPHSPIPLGIDSLLGFIPVIGGSMGVIFSLYQVYLSTTFGIPLWLFMHMLFNIVVDFIFSLIPIAGGFLHMFYKANIYNFEELKEYLESAEYLERVQLRERTPEFQEASPGEITWAQLGTDVKNAVPIPAIKKSINKKSS